MTQRAVRDEYVFDLSGGNLCLDFTNTVGGSRAHPEERLHSYADLLSWSRQAGAVDEHAAARLAQAAQQHPRDAAKALAQAIELREALFRIIGATLDLRAPETADLVVFNAVLQKALPHHHVTRAAGGFEMAWTEDTDALDRVLWPVVRAAVDLLVSPDLRRVRRCAGPTCDWLFMDKSRNQTRRWCDMKGCGNRAKARRYYERHRAHAVPAPRHHSG